jgi:hypothetical protein
MISSVNDCVTIPLNKIHDRAGNITIVEGMLNVPFSIKRVYYLYDIPGGETRGGHGHKELRQLIVAASGSFNVLLNDGTNTRTVTLNRPDFGLIIVPGIWRELIDFSSGAVCLVLASHEYNSDDYLNDFENFLQWKLLK